MRCGKAEASLLAGLSGRPRAPTLPLPGVARPRPGPSPCAGSQAFRRSRAGAQRAPLTCGRSAAARLVSRATGACPSPPSPQRSKPLGSRGTAARQPRGLNRRPGKGAGLPQAPVDRIKDRRYPEGGLRLLFSYVSKNRSGKDRAGLHAAFPWEPDAAVCGMEPRPGRETAGGWDGVGRGGPAGLSQKSLERSQGPALLPCPRRPGGGGGACWDHTQASGLSGTRGPAILRPERGLPLRKPRSLETPQAERGVAELSGPWPAGLARSEPVGSPKNGRGGRTRGSGGGGAFPSGTHTRGRKGKAPSVGRWIPPLKNVRLSPGEKIYTSSKNPNTTNGVKVFAMNVIHGGKSPLITRNLHKSERKPAQQSLTGGRLPPKARVPGPRHKEAPGRGLVAPRAGGAGGCRPALLGAAAGGSRAPGLRRSELWVMVRML